MLTLNVPADYSFVSVVRSLVTTLLNRLEVVEDDVYDVSIVVGEICSNVVRHAYRRASDVYVVEVGLQPGTVQLTVTDWGPGFDASQLREPSPDEGTGWGLWLVERLSKECSVVPISPHGTRVTAVLPIRYVTPEAAEFAARLLTPDALRSLTGETAAAAR